MIGTAKIWIKYCIALVFYYSGACRLLSSIKSRRSRHWPIVLMYHRIIEPKDAEGLQPGMYVYKDVFEKQIRYLASNFKICSISEFAAGLDNYSGYRGNDLIITIDDGWRDNYTNAFPILKKNNANAAIYLTINFIGTSYLFWFQEISSILSRPNLEFDRFADGIKTVLNKHPNSVQARELLKENIAGLLSDRDHFIEILKKLEPDITLEIAALLTKLTGNIPIQNDEERQMLDWDEVRLMAQAGIEFGSHGLTHRLLDSLDLDETFKELDESKNAIEGKIGKPICSVTYPNGNYNKDVEKLVEKAGYACAFIVGKNPASVKVPDSYAIDRTGVHNGVSTNPFGAYSKAMFAWHLYRNM